MWKTGANARGIVKTEIFSFYAKKIYSFRENLKVWTIYTFHEIKKKGIIVFQP